MRSLILAALVVAAPAAVQAQGLPTHAQTVADLAAICAPAVQGVQRLEAIAYCQGFVTSAAQFHAAVHPPGGRRAPVFCLPTPPPSVAEAALGFVAWAAANPARAQEPALEGVLRFARATYPCPPPARRRARS